MSTIVQSQLFRNDTNLDAIGAFEVPLKMPPPNAVESSPCGRVIAVSTQVGITFYWSSQTNTCRDVGVSRSLHTVELLECVSCMTFSSVSMKNMARLYLATNDRVIAWEISTLPKLDNEARRDDSDLGPRTTILEQPGQKDAMAISQNAKYLAVSVIDQVIVMEGENHSPSCCLEGHRGAINAMAFFSPHMENVLISVGEDRTFKLWDCCEQIMLYQSCVVSSSPFLSVAVDPSLSNIALGKYSLPNRKLGMVEGELIFYHAVSLWLWDLPLTHCPGARIIKCTNLVFSNAKELLMARYAYIESRRKYLMHLMWKVIMSIICSKSIAIRARKYITRILVDCWIVETIYDKGTRQYTMMMCAVMLCMMGRQTPMLFLPIAAQ